MKHKYLLLTIYA